MGVHLATTEVAEAAAFVMTFDDSPEQLSAVALVNDELPNAKGPQVMTWNPVGIIRPVELPGDQYTSVPPAEASATADTLIGVAGAESGVDPPADAGATELKPPTRTRTRATPNAIRLMNPLDLKLVPPTHERVPIRVSEPYRNGVWISMRPSRLTFLRKAKKQGLFESSRRTARDGPVGPNGSTPAVLPRIERGQLERPGEPTSLLLKHSQRL